MDEMNITSFSSALSQTFFLAWRWKMLFLYCVLQCLFFSEMVWSIEVLFSWRKNLTFVGAETGKFYISPGWLKLCTTDQPFEVRFLLFCCFCSEVEHVIIDWRTMDEMKNAPFSSSCPQRLFEAVGRSNLQRSNIFQASNIFQHSSSSSALTWRYHTPPTPPTPPSLNNNATCNVATSSKQATSSSIHHHPTHFTWRYHTPPTPPPTPPSLNNNATCNVATSSKQATSSSIHHHPTHFTWRYHTPPTPPICIQERPF